MQIVITCLFGLEHYCVEDLENIGYRKEDMTVTDGQILLSTTPGKMASDAARVCLWCRRGERVLLSIETFEAETFEAFFDGFSAMKWDSWIPSGAAFHVNGYSRDSKLFGIPACQSLAKKAIVKSLQTSRHVSEDVRIEEDEKRGLIKIVFGIVKDVVRVMIDITGEGLHKRGYRPLMHEAPIKETLAAGMVSAAQYKFFGEEALVDPFCGSGTIVIEAAMMALNIAPGLHRAFSGEALPYIGKSVYDRAREEAQDMADLSPTDDIYFYGSDIDPKAVQTAKNNAKAAGVSDFVRFKVSDFCDQTPEALLQWTNMRRQLILCNPPYGGRLLTPEMAQKIYKGIARTYLDSQGYCRKGIRLSVITPDDSFENQVARKADKRRKLYNGSIRCQLTNYYRLPPREK
ncbi:MAG: class I SAM-dependent RNA methyltransferase [Clostridiales bacterium]|nr:class I SAM-dependent RNA methyltransferase [Clostridiales bacterium]